MPSLLLAVLLSLGNPGAEQTDLRISIARVGTPDATPGNPEFAITLENTSDADFVVVLGYMLGNAMEMFPSAVSLVLRDQRGGTRTLVYRAPPRVGGRIDDYTVALRHHSSYVLRVVLGDYHARGHIGSNLAPGPYTVQATFEGLAASSTNADMIGVRLMHFWTGTVSSNVLPLSLTQTPRSGRSQVSSDDRATLIAALEHEAMRHRRHDVTVRQGAHAPPLDDPERLPQLATAVGELHDPASIPALAAALGSGFAAIRPLSAFGEQAVPAILAVEASTASSTGNIDEALIALRFIVEGASERGGLSKATHADLRRVAARRLTRCDGSPTTLWWAIDLAWSLQDEELRHSVEVLATNANVVAARGISDPGLIEQTLRRASARVAGSPPLPRP